MKIQPRKFFFHIETFPLRHIPLPKFPAVWESVAQMGEFCGSSLVLAAGIIY
jgi:hypothetical protein